jgi:seryl-tRNA(Sec) selenium transferase
MTSIEWLIEELTPSISLQQKYIDELKEQAKEMHKQEMKNAWFDSTMQFDNSAEMINKKSFDDYYQEILKNKSLAS